MIKNNSHHIELMIAAFNHCAEVIIIINEEGEIVEVNERIEFMFGYEIKELDHKPLNTLFPDKFKVIHKEHLKRFFNAPSVRSMGKAKDLYGKKKSGNIFPIEVSLSHFSQDGIKYGIAFVTDISERKTYEKRLKATIETAVDGICTMNSKGIIINVNKALCSLFGFSEEELIGHSVQALMPEETSHNHHSYVNNYLEGGTPRIVGIGRSVIAKKKNGDEFPIKLSIGEFVENDERFFTGIIHDMTNEWEIKAQLRKLNNELEERVEDRTKELANLVIKLERMNLELEEARNEAHVALEKERELSELKSRFVSMASHEFRTPLSTILSSTTLLGKYDGDDVNEKKEKHYNRIKSNVKNLTNILNDFLSLDKLESGVIGATKSLFDLEKFTHEIIEELSSSYLKLNQKIHLDFKGNKTLLSDPKILKNVLINLISNASKYSKEGDNIWLNMISKNESLTISIKDEGIGIPIEDQKHLFKRFFRANNVTNIKGTGLGLNIVKKYTELLSGTIELVDSSENGTTFRLFFISNTTNK